jgi:hypothetical protein
VIRPANNLRSWVTARDRREVRIGREAVRQHHGLDSFCSHQPLHVAAATRSSAAARRGRCSWSSRAPCSRLRRSRDTSHNRVTHGSRAARHVLGPRSPSSRTAQHRLDSLDGVRALAGIAPGTRHAIAARTAPKCSTSEARHSSSHTTQQHLRHRCAQGPEVLDSWSASLKHEGRHALRITNLAADAATSPDRCTRAPEPNHPTRSGTRSSSIPYGQAGVVGLQRAGRVYP